MDRYKADEASWAHWLRWHAAWSSSDRNECHGEYLRGRFRTVQRWQQLRLERQRFGLEGQRHPRYTRRLKREILSHRPRWCAKTISDRLHLWRMTPNSPPVEHDIPEGATPISEYNAWRLIRRARFDVRRTIVG